MIRMFDLLFSMVGLILFLPVILLLFLLGFFETKAPLFFQTRIGQHEKNFVIVKFRSMKEETASVASHLVDSSSITPLGMVLRKSKLDELPQLWNVLRGDMSLVGPRPCLPSQHELIAERKKRGVFHVRPGITGLAQINGIDMSRPKLLAETEAKMIISFSFKNYFKYICLTCLGKGLGDRVGLKK